MAEKDKPGSDTDANLKHDPSTPDTGALRIEDETQDDTTETVDANQDDVAQIEEEEFLEAEASDAPDMDDDHVDETEDDDLMSEASESDEIPEPDADTILTDLDMEIGEIEESELQDPPATERVVEREVVKRGGFGGALLGGVVAAGLGFAAGQSGLLDSVVSGGDKDNAAVTELTTKLTSQSEQIAELKAALAAVKMPDLTPLESGLSDAAAQAAAAVSTVDAVKANLAGLQDRLGPLDQRLTDVEKRPVAEGLSDEAIAAYERELQAMKDAVATQRQEMEAMIAETRAMEAAARELETKAAETAQQAANRAALVRIRAELDTGAPFKGLVDELTAGGVDVPDALGAVAAEGAVTMSALRGSFPVAARDALAAARAGTTEPDRSLTGFLQRQLGARSVQPRDGADPDAVLSRAEAALVNGRLSDALDEIGSLPEPAQEKLNDWVGLAALRVAAIDAVNSLAQDLNSN